MPCRCLLETHLELGGEDLTSSWIKSACWPYYTNFLSGVCQLHRRRSDKWQCPKSDESGLNSALSQVRSRDNLGT